MRNQSFLSRTARCLCASTPTGGYGYFEDFYPKAKPVDRYATYEDQQSCASVRNLEPKKQLSESERLHKVHKKQADVMDPVTKQSQMHPSYGWVDEWGPEYDEDGHNGYYKKNEQYMTKDEQMKKSFRHGVPLEKNEFRHQEMPYHNRVKAGYYNLVSDKPQVFDHKTKGYWQDYGDEDKATYIGKAKQEYMDEWLEKPGIDQSNMAMKMAEYNGTAENKKVTQVDRKPEWTLAPRPEWADDR